MRADTVIFFIFFAIVVLAKVIRKVMQVANQDVRPERRREAAFEASPQEIRDFLQSLAGQRQAHVRLPARPEAEPPVLLDVLEEPSDVPRRMVPPADAAPASREHGQRPAQARVPEAGPKTRARQRRRRRKTAPEPAQPSARKPAAEPPPGPVPAQALRAAAVTPLVLRGFGLKQAVVWREILGPPVSVRRGWGRQNRPGSQAPADPS